MFEDYETKKTKRSKDMKPEMAWNQKKTSITLGRENILNSKREDPSLLVNKKITKVQKHCWTRKDKELRAKGFYLK